MTPPSIEHVWTAKTRVNFGENFQVAIENWFIQSMIEQVSHCTNILWLLAYFPNYYYYYFGILVLYLNFLKKYHCHDCCFISNKFYLLTLQSTIFDTKENRHH